jgi:hypothetical protein
MDPQIKSQLPQTVSVKALASISGDQTPTYAAASSVSAYISEDVRVVVTPQGKEVQTDHVVLTEDAIAYTDALLLPDTTEWRNPQHITKAVDPETGTVEHYVTRL